MTAAPVLLHVQLGATLSEHRLVPLAPVASEQGHCRDVTG